MARKRKTQDTKEMPALPPGCKWVDIRVPVSVEPRELPTLFKVEARLPGNDERWGFTRIHHAMIKIDESRRDEFYRKQIRYSQSDTLRWLLQQIHEACGT